MRNLWVILSLFIVVPSAFSDASIPEVSRRQFIRSGVLCAFATLIDVSAHSPIKKAIHHEWSIHPQFDIETLGLESFGNSVKELLLKQGYAPDAETAERVRWNLQAKIWNRLEPASELSGVMQISSVVAVWLGPNRYLYLNPHFRIEPIDSPSTDSIARTIGKIRYISDTSDLRVLTYWLGEEPTDRLVLVTSI
ncbi:MAG: hypothetical protein H7301_12305 [Cryobacterium sp.]|nr:hypothetical protein [Oligoflexia bacterium]